MTTDKLRAKLLELQSGRERATANLNAVLGAISILTEIIAEDEQPTTPPTT